MTLKEQKISEIKAILTNYLDDNEEKIIFKEIKAVKTTSLHEYEELYASGVGFCLQGKKEIKVKAEKLIHCEGKLMGAFIPAPVELRIIEASPEKPFLGVGFFLDNERLSKILLRISQIEEITKPKEENPCVVFDEDASEEYVDVLYRLVKLLDKPAELKMLGDQLVDEMYFRILYNTKAEIYKHLLYNKAQFRHISKSVDYIYQNIDKVITVDELADTVNMSVSGFHKKFKDVLNISPLQYIKIVKLDKAKAYLMQGANVSQAAELVGYNSLAQFSREYKRHFGILPSKR